MRFKHTDPLKKVETARTEGKKNAIARQKSSRKERKFILDQVFSDGKEAEREIRNPSLTIDSLNEKGNYL